MSRPIGAIGNLVEHSAVMHLRTLGPLLSAAGYHTNVACAYLEQDGPFVHVLLICKHGLDESGYIATISEVEKRCAKKCPDGVRFRVSLSVFDPSRRDAVTVLRLRGPRERGKLAEVLVAPNGKVASVREDNPPEVWSVRLRIALQELEVTAEDFEAPRMVERLLGGRRGESDG